MVYGTTPPRPFHVAQLTSVPYNTSKCGWLHGTKRNRSEGCVYAAYLCYVGEKAAVATTMLEQCIKQQLYLFACPAVGSPMPPFLSQ